MRGGITQCLANLSGKTSSDRYFWTQGENPMTPSYTPFVKAKDAEAKALANLETGISRRIRPLFDVDKPPSGKTPKYMSESATPRIAYLERAIDIVASIGWGGSVMADTYQWQANAVVETGENVASFVVAALRSRGVDVIPVIGYDRWGDLEYREAIAHVPFGPGGRMSIRLDDFAISDAAEPGLLEETVTDILDVLGIDPARCAILIDFGDVSGGSNSVLDMSENAQRVIRCLADFGFEYFSVIGCSLPPSIDLAVPSRDTEAPVLRKEMVLWQMLRQEFPELAITSGDYCVRGPTSTSAPVKHINGKIRYTIPRNHFVVRGHSRVLDGNFDQMYDLAEKLMASGHFLGESFSWGDGELATASGGEGSCGLAAWIAIDTNHHITHVVHEVLEFERVLAARESAANTVV
jgi:hypothetical protein